MGIKFANFATSTIANVGGIGASDVSLDVQPGDGALFPTLAAGDYFYAVLVSSGGTREIVKVTARSTDTFTIDRAEEGTSAAVFAAGSVVELRLTAGSFDVLVKTTDTQTLTNKTLTSPVINTPTGDVATLTGAQTLTNKTLTSPVINTGVSGTAILDEDTMASDSPTQLATQQSIKAYVDSKSAYTTASPGGDFTSGTVYFAKAGRVVTMSWSALGHSSNSSPDSASGVIPSQYRPISDTGCVFHSESGGIQTIRVDSATGQFFFFYRDWAGSLSAKTTSEDGTISWVSAS